MTIRLASSLVLSLALLAAACGESRVPPGNTGTNKDASTTDSGGQQGPVDGGTNPGQDATTNPGQDASTNPGQDASVNPGQDASVNPGACTVAPDSCTTGQYCQIDNQGVLACIAEGGTAVGAACDQAACTKGGMCINVGDGAKCYEPCDPASPSCTEANASCLGLQGISFGICQVVDSCDPVNPNSCMSNETCQVIQQDGTSACTAAGSATLGMPCSGPCAHGLMCLDLTGSGGVCYQPCTPNVTPSTCPNNGTCQGLQTASGPLPWGVCQ